MTLNNGAFSPLELRRLWPQRNEFSTRPAPTLHIFFSFRFLCESSLGLQRAKTAQEIWLYPSHEGVSTIEFPIVFAAIKPFWSHSQEWKRKRANITIQNTVLVAHCIRKSAPLGLPERFLPRPYHQPSIGFSFSLSPTPLCVLCTLIWGTGSGFLREWRDE